MPEPSPLDPPARVLLAEDDPDLSATLRAVLEEQGYEVLAATNGSETLAILSGVAKHALPRPHVIVSDIRMPGLSGLELLRAVRLAEWPTPVVLMTAFPDGRVRDRASWLGAFALLEKPLGIARLLDVVAAALGTPVAAR